MQNYAQAIDRSVELAKPPVVEVNGDQYVAEGYRRAAKPTEERDALINAQEIERMALEHEQQMLKLKLDFNSVSAFENITTLSSLCDMIKAEVKRKAAAFPFFVSVQDYNRVTVYGSYEVNFSRRHLYSAVADNKDFHFSTKPLEQAIIALQSQYVNGGDVEYIIDLCSRISKQADVTTEDNGVSQKVQTTKGIALKTNETVRNRVLLRPFRTFMEVPQPESEYLLRLSEIHGVMSVSLIESDGGAWKLTAKANIAEYLKEHLAGLIDDGSIIVLQ
jgi:hypothetical protein